MRLRRNLNTVFITLTRNADQGEKYPRTKDAMEKAITGIARTVRGKLPVPADFVVIPNVLKKRLNAPPQP